MTTKRDNIWTRYFNSLSWCDVCLVAALISIYIFGFFASFYTQSKQAEWPDISALSDFLSQPNIRRFWIYAVVLLILSTILRQSTKDSKDHSWRYMAIVAFSIVGSVVVALITNTAPIEQPFLCALALALFHFGYWCWKREHIETSVYQEQVKTTTLRLEHILNTMPKEDAFKVMGEDTASIFNMLYMITSMSQTAKEDSQRQEIAEMAKEQIKQALSSMSRIASLWTVSSARLFEANIMRVVPAERASEIPEAEVAFERGKYFFPDTITLDTIHLGCEKCLYVLTELATNTSAHDPVAQVKPLMLPVYLTSKTHPGFIKGAPEAAEKGRIISIKEISEIIQGLPENYVGTQKQKIVEYFKGQEKCGSILSIPLVIKELDGTPAAAADDSVDAVINLYRPEHGLIKSPELFQEFTRPLVQMIANLLYLYMENTKTRMVSEPPPSEATEG